MAATSQIPVLPAEEYERRRRRADSTLQPLWALLDEVKDPEIPVISIWELGILQDIGMRDGTVVVERMEEIKEFKSLGAV